MVTLTDKQEQHVQRLAQLKQHYDVQLAALELDFARQKNALKNPLREEVAQSLADGVPKRQIHKRGLGFEYVNSMYNFLDQPTPAGERLAGMLDTTPTVEGRPVQAVTPMLRDDGYSIITLDREGLEVKLDYSNTPPYRESRWFQFDVDTLDRDTLRAISTYKGKGWYISEEDCPDWLRDELPEDYWD